MEFLGLSHLHKQTLSNNNRQLLDNIDQNPVLLSTMALATIAVAGIARNTGIADSLFDAFADLISMLPFESYRYYGVSEKSVYYQINDLLLCTHLYNFSFFIADPKEKRKSLSLW